MLFRIWKWILSFFHLANKGNTDMFNESKWQELISSLRNLTVNSSGYIEIYTKATNQLNLIKITSSNIYVATKKDWNTFNEIPRDMVETTYNNLLNRGSLSQNDISKGLNVKRSAFIIAALELLPEIQYEKSSNSLLINKDNLQEFIVK